MTRRKKPLNKTIANKALEHTKLLPGGIGYVRAGRSVGEITSLFKGNDGAITLTIEPKFILPDDLDKIQPEQINGNLTIKFPE